MALVDRMDTSRDKEFEKGKGYCLRLLAVRSRTEQELNTRLKNKGYSTGTREGLVGFLKEKGLIDDLKFSKDWIDSRLSSNPRSSKMIRLELERMGIDDNVINEIFSARSAELDDKKIATGLAKKKLREIEVSSDIKAKGKVFRYLAGKGFDLEIAEEVVNELVG